MAVSETPKKMNESLSPTGRQLANLRIPETNRSDPNMSASVLGPEEKSWKKTTSSHLQELNVRSLQQQILRLRSTSTGCLTKIDAPDNLHSLTHGISDGNIKAIPHCAWKNENIREEIINNEEELENEAPLLWKFVLAAKNVTKRNVTK
eukprot:gene12431-13716_t